jgi:hypothetical protein
MARSSQTKMDFRDRQVNWLAGINVDHVIAGSGSVLGRRLAHKVSACQYRPDHRVHCHLGLR